MRPRVFPAEDLCSEQSLIQCLHRFNEAAGIPRGRRSGAVAETGRVVRFNEAAGIPRGRLGRVETDQELIAASMRPRVFPAEDFNLPASIKNPHLLQ